MSVNERMLLSIIGIWLVVAPACANAQEWTTAEEVIQKTREAAEYLAKERKTGIDTFKTSNSPYTWKDGYVVVMDCAHGKFLTNPVYPEMNGMNLDNVTDVMGTRLGMRLCQKAAQPKGGWVDYKAPKPGGHVALRKLTYIRHVEETLYDVAAGIYDDTASIDDLQKLSDAQ
jgi:cytochrome c